MIIYHNPRCSKSRNGFNYLQDKGIECEVKEYLKEGIEPEELKRILSMLGKSPLEMIRTQEEYYKKELKGKDFSDEELIEIICQNPKLLQRPIVINGDKAVFAQPADEIDNII